MVAKELDETQNRKLAAELYKLMAEVVFEIEQKIFNDASQTAKS